MINILIADDHAIVRRGLQQILSETPDMRVSAEAADGAEALRKARTELCDAVVLDISMPACNGFEIIKTLKLERPALPVLVLSVHAEDQFALRVLKAGAGGYITKENAPDELVKAIRRVLAGRKYISPGLAELLAADLGAAPGRPRHAALSDREFQVMRLLAGGKTVTVIADELALSVKTISTYRARILEKLQLHNTAEIMHYAFENHLID